MKGKPLLPAILWATFIMIICGIPGRDIPHISFLELLSFDKWVHAGVFGLLTVFLVKGFRLQQRSFFFQKKAAWMAVLIAAAYGGLIEILQGTIFEGRSADPFDFIADSFGAVVVLLLYPVISKKFPKLRLPL